MIFPSLLVSALRVIGYGDSVDCRKTDATGAPKVKLATSEWSEICAFIEDRHAAVVASARLGKDDAAVVRGMQMAADIADRIAHDALKGSLFGGSARDSHVAEDVAAAIRRSAAEIEREDRGALARKVEEGS